jgi:dTDP-glucose 4,6-dehydratase
MSILVTGHRGFIGSHLVVALAKQYPTERIVGMDAETYAARPPMYSGRIQNLVEVKGDIRDQAAVAKVFSTFKVEHVIHMAAESHVCRSIIGPKDFITTNINGTFNLLEEARNYWGGNNSHRFLYFSTDEVFGEIKEGSFDEQSRLQPRSPYAASKASGDMLVECYRTTYGLNTVIINASNNFGPNQHDEKLIPRTIGRILSRDFIELYGSGEQIRDWYYVKHCVESTISIFRIGFCPRYCLGGGNELTNAQVVKKVHWAICEITRKEWPFNITYNMTARPTDDYRYSLNTTLAQTVEGVRTTKDFENSLLYTIGWYCDKLLSGGGPHYGWRG